MKAFIDNNCDISFIKLERKRHSLMSFFYFKDYKKIEVSIVINTRDLDAIEDIYDISDDEVGYLFFTYNSFDYLYLIVALKFLYDKKDFDNYNIMTSIVADDKEIKMLVRKISRKEDEKIPLKLVPFIEGSNNKILSLKLGNTKLYMVQNIDNLLESIKYSSSISLGKNIFNCDYYNFDEKSQNLINGLETINYKNFHISKNIVFKGAIIDMIYNVFSDNFININNKSVFISKLIYEKSVEIIDGELVFDYEGEAFYGNRDIYILENDILYKLNIKNTKEMKTIVNILLEKKKIKIYDNEDFIKKIYPIIQKDIIVDQKFLERYPKVSLDIDSYFVLEDDGIVLKYIIYENQNIVNSAKDLFYEANKDGFMKYIEEVNNLGYTPYNEFNYIMMDTDLIAEFLKTDLSILKKFGNVYVSDEIKNIQIKQFPNFSISVNYGVDLLSFEFSNELSNIEIINIINSYKKKKKYYRLNDNSIISLDEDVNKMINMLDDYNLDYKKIGQGETKPYTHILKFLNETNPNIKMDKKILEILEDLKSYKQSNYKIPEKLQEILRSYQQEAFYWMNTLIKHRFGGILADDMGLGKTLEVISVIISDAENMPSIIVCPTSLVFNWYNEFAKWDSSIKVVPLYGNAVEREGIINLIHPRKKVMYITSYDILRRDVKYYKDITFRFIIADESQFIKNQYALKSEALKKLTGNIRFSLTGTPIENSLADLWSIFDFVMPGYLNSYNKFKERYENLIMNDDKEALQNLVRKVTPFILRRTKQEVLSDLPEKFENIYYVKMSSEQQKIYDSYFLSAVREIDEVNKMQVLALITRLRQICVDPGLFLEGYNELSGKIEFLQGMLLDYIALGHKILLFSQFKSVFSIISNYLDENNVKYFTLTGETNSLQRVKMVDEFNNDKDVKIFLISLKAGGTGLNLIGADTIIHLDPWWNLSAQNQATDRAHRIGQTNKVEVIKIICANSIEQKVIELQNKKIDLANSIINSDEFTTSLSKDDIKYIFS